MTNKQFNNLLLRLAKANEKYSELLDLAEDEFVRRYGKHPSDIDFDSWIDVYHGPGGGYLSAEEIDEEYKGGLHNTNIDCGRRKVIGVVNENN